MGLKEARAFIERNDNFLIISHVSPDGDTLGSGLALYSALRYLKKNAQIACEQPVPPLYAFLRDSDKVLGYDEVKPFESIIYVDCADLSRAGKLAGFALRAKNSLCIDHHETNPLYADVNWIEDCAATGEMMYLLIRELKAPLDCGIAEQLFCALATDTGNFAYSNTTAQTFEIAGKLLESGIDLPELNRKLFRTMRLQKAKLIGLTLNRIELYLNGTFGISYIYKDEMLKLNATDADCEGLIDYVRDIDSVELACTLRESLSGRIRVSFRSKHDIDVTELAAQFGGGGHARAAGCTLDCSMDEALTKIKEAGFAFLS
ncbi:MAG: bifunctional oligoribonuclease/PAP phosphatase NrnA [Clostridia bacterium]|nr:bifunctional oligoribonuclease/PAP phosphatase NrnA [Clostridia bacterium]